MEKKVYHYSPYAVESTVEEFKIFSELALKGFTNLREGNEGSLFIANAKLPKNVNYTPLVDNEAVERLRELGWEVKTLY